MIWFAYSFYEKMGHPKMYDAACRLMGQAHRTLYSDSALKRLQKEIDTALRADLPQGHAARLVCHRLTGAVCLYLATGKVDDEVARLYFSAVKDAVGVSCYERPDLPARTRAK